MDTNEFDDFKEYLAIQNSKVLGNCTTIASKDLDQKFMLHIDKQSPKFFIPMMPRRAAADEDNTVPRVTVADSILGCLLAYYVSLDDVLKSTTTNGYYINALDFEYCVKPSKELVFDADDTGEHWLLGYSKKTLRYVPFTIGKLFIVNVSFKPNTVKGYNDIHGTIFLEITEDLEVTLFPGCVLKKGYYKLDIDFSDLNNGDKRLSIHDTDKFLVTSISEVTYNNAKKVSASLLDTSSVNIPLFKNW